MPDTNPPYDREELLLQGVNVDPPYTREEIILMGGTPDPPYTRHELMLMSYAGGGGDEGDDDAPTVVILHETETTVEYNDAEWSVDELDKTWQEIFDLFDAGAIIFVESTSAIHTAEEGEPESWVLPIVWAMNHDADDSLPYGLDVGLDSYVAFTASSRPFGHATQIVSE